MKAHNLALQNPDPEYNEWRVDFIINKDKTDDKFNVFLQNEGLIGHITSLQFIHYPCSVFTVKYRTQACFSTDLVRCTRLFRRKTPQSVISQQRPCAWSIILRYISSCNNMFNHICCNFYQVTVQQWWIIPLPVSQIDCTQVSAVVSHYLAKYYL